MSRREWMSLSICSAVSLCTIRLIEQTGEPDPGRSPYRPTPPAPSTIEAHP
jgi:hypothetical protein